MLFSRFDCVREILGDFGWFWVLLGDSGAFVRFVCFRVLLATLQCL